MSIKVVPNSLKKALERNPYDASGFIGNHKYVEYIKNRNGYERMKVHFLNNKKQYLKDTLTFERNSKKVYFKKGTTANEVRTKTSPLKEVMTYLIDGIKVKKVTYDKQTGAKKVQLFDSFGLPIKNN